jgi:lipid-binding SYLF domain-containing protein
MNRLLPVASVLLLALAAPATAAPPPAQTLESSIDILDELAAIPLKGIPPALLHDAQGVAIIPRVIKAGFVFGGRGGHGVVLARDKDGNWSNPTFINIGGASVGFQAGVEATDLVLVFRTRKSLERLLDGRSKLTLGADAAVAAGPVGRQAAAATDGRLQAEIVSYSRSRGLFAGVSLDGAVIHADSHINTMFARDMRPETARLVETLKMRLAESSTMTMRAGPRQILPPPPPVFLGPPMSTPSLVPPPAVPMAPPTIPVVPMIPASPGRP